MLQIAEFYPTLYKGKPGVSPHCIGCDKLKAKAYREKNRERNAEKNKEHYETYKTQILEQKKQYGQENKERISKYLKDNKERFSARKKKYYQEHKEYFSDLGKQWRENNPHITRMYNQQRRMKKDELAATLTPEEWEVIKREFSNQCAYCGKVKKLDQEHFIPLSAGGEYTHNNIIPACKSCNSSKRDKDFFAWYPQQSIYSKKRERKILKYLKYNADSQEQQLTIGIL